MTETRGWSPLYLLMSSQIAAALVLSVFVNKFNNTASWYVFVLTTAPFTVSAVMGAHAPSGDSSSVASAPLP
jgi:hypothetical protein